MKTTTTFAGKTYASLSLTETCSVKVVLHSKACIFVWSHVIVARLSRLYK